MQKDPSPAHPKEGARLAFESSVAPYLKSLKAHCYRMCGSWFEAEDLLQESLVRAWRGLHTFRGDASLKTWLYSVTTRACLDLLEKRRERSLPFTLGLKSDGSTPPEGPDFEVPWIEPMPGEPDDEALGPEARLTRRESVALAFLALLQRVPPKQRAVLLLRDVLGSSAQECAALLETSVASVNSALQRARAALE
ncbi:MAG: RNA polymerase subunit sigma-70, partial [Myxococcaceae bacterium]